jgi:hypothetical protein
MAAERHSIEHGDGARCAPLQRRPKAGKLNGLPVGVYMTGRRSDGTFRCVRASMSVDGELYFKDFSIKRGSASYNAAVRKAIAHRAKLEEQVFGDSAHSRRQP